MEVQSKQRAFKISRKKQTPDYFPTSSVDAFQGTSDLYDT